MVHDRAMPTTAKSYMVYRTVPFSTNPNPDFKVMPLFDAEYLRNG